MKHEFFLFTIPFPERENVLCSRESLHHLLYFTWRMARSPDDIEEHLPSDIAMLEPAGVLLLEKRRHGAGSKHRLSSTGPLTVPSGQSKSLLNSLGVALQQVKGTEMMGHTFSLALLHRGCQPICCVGQLTRCLSLVCMHVCIGDLS